MTSQDVQSLLHDMTNARKWFLPDWNTRIAAARQLGQLQAIKAVSALRAVVLHNENADLARAALQALGQIGGDSSRKIVSEILSGKELAGLHPTAMEVMEAMINDLGSSKTAAAVDTLLELWSVLPVSLYPAVERALLQLGPNYVGVRLFAAIDHPNPQLSETAAKLLPHLATHEMLLEGLRCNSDRVRKRVRPLLTAAGAAVVEPLLLSRCWSSFARPTRIFRRKCVAFSERLVRQQYRH